MMRRIMEIIFPKRCVFCGALIAPARRYCRRCGEEKALVEPPICLYCGQNKKRCGCSKHHAAFDGVAAPFYYETAVKRGILRLKRRFNNRAIQYFAEQMAHTVQREYGKDPITAITYVPTSIHSLIHRGYNPSEKLAAALGERLELPVRDTLTKLYKTPPQKEMDLRARSGNVLGVFEVTDKQVQNGNLLLVDDVMTTGATLHECSKMLKIHGAKQVHAVTVAVRRFEKKTE